MQRPGIRMPRPNDRGRVRGMIMWFALVACVCWVSQVGAAPSRCSAKAETLWKSKCPARTSENKEFLPVTDMAKSEINIDDAEITAAYKNARQQSLKISGNVGNAAMAGMRKKPQEWYEQSLKRMLTYLCVKTSTSESLERCVAPTSPFAAKDIDKQCIQVADEASCHRQGQCERMSNCKWDEAYEGASSRRELFSNDQIVVAKRWMEKEYPTSLAPFVAPGIVFAVLMSLSCAGFLVLRCIFNQCGGRNPNEKGYSRCDILIPSVIFVVCSVAVFICTLVTVAQNANVSIGVNGVLNSLNVTLENIDIFSDNLKAPLRDADSKLNAANIVVSERVKELEWIDQDAQKLRDMIQTFGEIYLNKGPFPASPCDPKLSVCVPCPESVCGSPLKQFLEASGVTLNATSIPVSDSVKTIQDAFVQRVTRISRSLRTAAADIDEVSTMTERSKATVATIKTTFDNYSFSRSGMVLFVFLLGLFSSMVGIFGIYKGTCTKQSAWTQLLHVSWLVGALVCIVGFVLSASLLAVGAVWYDSCNYLNILHTDVSPYLPSQMASVMNACFNDSSLLGPLGIEDHIAFSCAIDDNYDQLSKADFTTHVNIIDTYGAKVSDFDLKTFGFESSVSRDLISKANTALKDLSLTSGFTQESIVSPWELFGEPEGAAAATCVENPNTNSTLTAADRIPLCYMDAKCSAGTGPTSSKDKCKQAFANAYHYKLAFTKISTIIDEMREDLMGDTGNAFSDGWKFDVSIHEFAASYYKRLAEVKTTTLDSLMQGEVGRVLESIEKIRCTENCGWINISYNAMHESLCRDVLGTTLAISLCVLFLCIFLIPMIVTGITLSKRLRGAKKGTYEQLEQRLQALEIKAKEEARAKQQAGGNGSKKGIDLFNFKKNLTSA